MELTAPRLPPFVCQLLRFGNLRRGHFCLNKLAVASRKVATVLVQRIGSGKTEPRLVCGTLSPRPRLFLGHVALVCGPAVPRHRLDVILRRVGVAVVGQHAIDWCRGRVVAPIKSSECVLIRGTSGANRNKDDDEDWKSRLGGIHNAPRISRDTGRRDCESDAVESEMTGTTTGCG
jgi:hypothetical protein